MRNTTLATDSVTRQTRRTGSPIHFLIHRSGQLTMHLMMHMQPPPFQLLVCIRHGSSSPRVFVADLSRPQFNQLLLSVHWLCHQLIRRLSRHLVGTRLGAKELFSQLLPTSRSLSSIIHWHRRTRMKAIWPKLRFTLQLLLLLSRQRVHLKSRSREHGEQQKSPLPEDTPGALSQEQTLPAGRIKNHRRHQSDSASPAPRKDISSAALEQDKESTTPRKRMRREWRQSRIRRHLTTWLKSSIAIG